VQALCKTCIHMKGGRVVEQGPSNVVVPNYIGAGITAEAEVDLQDHPGRAAGSTPVVRAVRFVKPSGEETASIFLGETLRVQLLLDPPQPLSCPSVGIGVNDISGQRIFTVHTRYSASQLDRVAERTWVECELPSVTLMPGRYTLKIAVGVAGHNFDTIEEAAAFEVLPHDVFQTGDIPTPAQGLVIQPSIWRTVREGVLTC
jgi:hypothetical protein